MLRTLLTITALTVLTALPAIAQDTEDRPEIMVLGVFHFNGGGADYINPQVDNYLVPTRQDEIQAVADALARFDPTKIIVELTPDGEARFNELYQAYQAGEHELSVNERQQIGMRLAAQLGHDHIYAADYSADMDFDAMFAAGAANGQDDLLERLPGMRADIEAHDALYNQAHVSVGERLIATNDPEMIALHNVYLTLAQLGSADDPVGANEMANWWGRNLHIFAQIAQISEPEDRVLVIYGAGHKFLLDQFIDDAIELELVDPLDYLEE